MTAQMPTQKKICKLVMKYDQNCINKKIYILDENRV